MNGLSNLFWGWGREDDELYMRILEAKMSVSYVPPRRLHPLIYICRYSSQKVLLRDTILLFIYMIEKRGPGIKKDTSTSMR